MANVSSSNGLEKRPKLRFPGFDEPWKRTEIGDVCEQLHETIDPSIIPDEYFTEYSMPAFDNEQTASSVQGKEMNSVRKILSKPCVLVNKLNVRKKRVWLIPTPEQNAVASAEFVPLASDYINLEFLLYSSLTDRFTNYLLNCSSGSSNSQKRVTPDVILNYVLEVPTRAEQNKISDCLSLLDKRIGEQVRLIKYLKKYKRGLLDKVFPPKKDLPFPTVRLSEMADFLQGLTYSPSDVANSGYLVLRSSNIQNAALSFNDCVYVDMEIPTCLQVKQGDIIMCVRNGSKKLVGKSAMIPCEMPMTTWGAFMMVIRSKICGSYIYQYLNSQAFYSQVFKDTGTATINQITKGILNECELPLPSENERDRITALLETFDKRIENSYSSLLRLKDLRKSLLQQLFI